MELADTVRAVVDDVAPLVGTGKVADYIPALARVPADRFGIAVHTVDNAFGYLAGGGLHARVCATGGGSRRRCASCPSSVPDASTR